MDNKHDLLGKLITDPAELKRELEDWMNPPSMGSVQLSRRNSQGSITSRSSSSTVRSKNYFCDYEGCSKSFTRPSLLTEHQMSFHQGIKPFKCNQCDKSFGRKNHLERHLNSHKTDLDKPYHCQYCNKGVTTMQQLKRHEITHTKSFECPYEGCTESFYKHPQLRSHILSFHLEKLTCKHCGKKFQRPNRLESHMQKHHNPNVKLPYACTFSGCLKHFKTWTQLTLHVKNDHPKLQCKICDKFCVGEDGLDMHMKIHDDSLVTRNWKCKSCSDDIKSFSKKHDLIEHYKEAHPDITIPYEILNDNKQTIKTLRDFEEDTHIVKKRRLDKNKNIHTDELESIGNEISLQNYLESDTSKNNVMDLLLNTVGRKLKCPYNKCYRTFKTQERYQMHIDKHKIHELKLKLLKEKELSPGSLNLKN